MDCSLACSACSFSHGSLRLGVESGISSKSMSGSSGEDGEVVGEGGVGESFFKFFGFRAVVSGLLPLLFQLQPLR
eukprot:11586231-Prorocentrum_lima.AAC.1